MRRSAPSVTLKKKEVLRISSRKWQYFRKLLLNGLPSALAVGGALITPNGLIRTSFIILAVIIYVVVAFNQAGAMVSNDDFHERVGASAKFMKDVGLMPDLVSIKGKPVKSDKKD